MAVETENTNEETVPVKKKNGIAGIIFYLLSLVAVPVVLIFTLMFFMLTNSFFYVSILKNADLINSFISARNWQVENEVKDEIEKEVHLEKFKKEYAIIKKNYEVKKKSYYIKNRTPEYRSLRRKRKELSNLEFQKAPDTFKSEADFENYRENELKKVNRNTDEIEEYREKHEDEIEKYEDLYDEAKDEFEDAEETLEEKTEDAKEIVRDHKTSFSGRVMEDMEKIAPVLTRELNSKFIEGPVKREIEKLIRFFTSYEVAVQNRAVRFNSFGTVESVRLPDLSLSLLVADEVNGVAQKRHLFSQVFADRIRSAKELNEKKRLLELFTFTESGFAEMIGRHYLKDARLSIDDGVIRVNRIVLKGDSAVKAAGYMNILSELIKYFYYMPLAALVLFFVTIITAGKNKRLRRAGGVLFIPSLILLVPGILVLIISFSATDIYRKFFTDLVFNVGTKAASVIGLYFFGPVVIGLGVLALTGFLLRKTGKKL